MSVKIPQKSYQWWRRNEGLVYRLVQAAIAGGRTSVGMRTLLKEAIEWVELINSQIPPGPDPPPLPPLP